MDVRCRMPDVSKRVLRQSTLMKDALTFYPDY
jgi:hypothetical protein